MGLGIGMMLSVRYTLYFPAKATGNYLSFKGSFHLSKGLALRLATMHAIPGFVTKCLWLYCRLRFPPRRNRHRA
jgi:uncharacterized membrane protein YciS (DUF1049 family)